MTATAVAPPYLSPWKDDDVRSLGAAADEFFNRELLPHRERFEAQQRVDRDVWRRAGEQGLLMCSVPEEYGGGGGTFAHDLEVLEAQARALETGFGNAVHSGIVAHYLLAYGSDEQRTRWLPRMAKGELVGAVAMTEPSAGSDLKAIRTRAVRQGDHYVVNGAKTFITNGQTADLVIVVAKTDPTAGAKGISLLVLETEGADGFERGRVLNKIGQHAADTSELFFDNVRIPTANLLGDSEGLGFGQLMAQLPQERLILACQSATMMERAVQDTIAYTKSRSAFGKPLFDLQTVRFTLAECQTVAQASRVFVDSCVTRHLAGELDPTTAAMAKWWVTENLTTTVDRCLQLFGGYGYMTEYPIARLFADGRVQRIYGGANEIMKEIIGRSL